MFTSIKYTTLSIFVLLLTASIALSQGVDDDYRKWSFTLTGGASLGDLNQSDYFMSSNFSVDIENTPTLGGGIQYALTPAWSLELGYRYTQIKGRTIPFETSMNLFTMKNIINLNQVLFTNQSSNRINPFLSAGFGYDTFTYDGPDEEFYAQNSSYNAGVGLAYRLSNTVDLISHYEYHLASNLTDNEIEGYGADFINTMTAGVRINLGEKNTRHISWRPAPVEISKSDYNQLLAQSNLLDDIERRLDKIAQRQQKQKEEYNQQIASKSEEIDSLKARLERLDKDAEDLKNSLTELDKESTNIKINNKTGFAESLPGGHYVQVFATLHRDIAQNIRNYAAQSLEEVLRNSGQEIIIIQRKEFYEVMIGVFDNFEQAQKVQGVMTDNHDDAYVISFPRPVNLQQDFVDLKILEDKPLVDIFD